MKYSVNFAFKASAALLCLTQPAAVLAHEAQVEQELSNNVDLINQVIEIPELDQQEFWSHYKHKDIINQQSVSNDAISTRRMLKDEEAEPCVVDSDCEYYPYTLCDNETRFCYHKPMFPTTGLEIAGVIVFSFIKAASNVAGIGGGGITIPIVMQFFYFTTKPAIAISSFAILVGSFARFAVNWREKHPEKPYVVSIDYGMTMVMMPTTLAGAQIGSFILITFPSLAIQIMLTLMLIFLTVKSGQKGCQIYRKETLAIAAAKKAEKEKANPAATAVNSEVEMSKKEQTDADGDEKAEAADDKNEEKPEDQVENKEDDKKEEEKPKADPKNTIVIQGKVFQLGESAEKDRELKKLKSLAHQEDGHGQWIKQGLNFFLLIILVLMNLFRGNSSMESIIGVEKCSAWEHIITVIFVLICILFTYIAVIINAKEQDLKEKYGINFVKSDVRLKGKPLVKVLLIGFIGGWVAGALGLGGGAIFNPALLSLGVPPVVSSATGMYLVCYSKIASCFVYALNGQLDIDYCLWIGLWSVISSALSLYAADWYMRKFKRQSIIVWILTFILGLSAVAVPIFGGISLKVEADKGIDIYKFNSLCE